MTQKIDDLIAAGTKCTKFELNTAESYDEGETCECPLCDGDGYVVTDTYMNMDGVALNVQFSGVGEEFINWQKFVKLAANAREDIKAMHEDNKRLQEELRIQDEANEILTRQLKEALGDKRDE